MHDARPEGCKATMRRAQRDPMVAVGDCMVVRVDEQSDVVGDVVGVLPQTAAPPPPRFGRKLPHVQVLVAAVEVVDGD